MRKVNRKIKADKKAKLDKEQWNAALDQLESKGFLTRVFDPDSGELINRPTKAGVDTYRCILAFYETDHLFNGPRVDTSDITDEEASIIRGYTDHEAGHIRHTNFRAIELRYYFNPIDIKFDLIFAKGLLAEFQLAGFYDQGTVSPDLGENFWKNFKDTRGIGLRLITGSAVSRIDYGISDEGGETIIYWDYPF